MGVTYNSHPYGLLTYTSPSAKMTRGPNGLLRFGAHNLYLNSAAPANQSITVVSGATYRVVITGSVSITASGATTGVMTAGTYDFTASTGTLTFGSTSGAGTVHVRRTPSDPLYLSTAGVARFALPYEWTLAGLIEGILVEPTATNLLLRSNELATTWDGFQSSATNAAATGPDGTLSLSKFFATATAGVHTRTQIAAGTTNTNAYVASCFVKAAEHSSAILSFYEGTTLVRASGIRFNAATQTFSDAFTSGGATSHAYNYEDWGAGVYRVWNTCVLGGTDTQIQVRFAAHNGTSNSFTGDGASGIYLGGAQLETGIYPTSPIFTYGATAIRASDLSNMLLSALPFFSATALTLYGEFKLKRPSITGTWTQVVSMDDGTGNNRYDLEVESGSYKARMNVTSGGVNNAYTDLGTITQDAVQKAAMSVSGTTSAKGARNGVGAAEDTAVVTPIGLANLKFGYVGGASQLHGYLRKVALYNRALTQAELNAITA